MKTLLPKWNEPPHTAEAAPPPFQPTPELLGIWTGHVHTYTADLPLRLEFLSDGHVLLQVGDQVASVVSEVKLSNGTLEGTALGELGTPDLQRHEPYRLLLDLQLRGNELTGSVTANAYDPRPFALTHWAQLQKQQ